MKVKRGEKSGILDHQLIRDTRFWERDQHGRGCLCHVCGTTVVVVPKLKAAPRTAPAPWFHEHVHHHQSFDAWN